MAPDVLLDSRRALVHTRQEWLAVADVHFGYEVQRRRQGALLPQWGMAACEETLRDLVTHHQPRRLILVGDIMDGSGSATETAGLLDRLQALVGEIVCILGNHDRAALKKAWRFVATHREEAFTFSHGHEWRVDGGADTEEAVTHVIGHEHPAIDFNDGAGLNLKLPAFVQERVNERTQRWVLPAFSPWAAGGQMKRRPGHERLATWACAPTRVWRHETSV
ncbi:MAG TPA: metallophosphoesterase [Prosthecobacter sp.]|nr:metallophosphoesterase [Prosthecobacter sp.]